MIPFNIPPSVGTELSYIGQAIENKKICGDGEFTKKCRALLSDVCRNEKVFLTTSCAHALEMAALLCGIQDGDEVILPSFMFCSTADAFVHKKLSACGHAVQMQFGKDIFKQVKNGKVVESFYAKHYHTTYSAIPATTMTMPTACALLILSLKTIRPRSIRKA